MTESAAPASAPAVEEATDRLLGSVAGLDDGAWAAPTVLPDWTRAHVLAHLALNAEGLTGALNGLADAAPTPIYASNEARDQDIADLAARRVPEIRDRLAAGCAGFADAVRRTSDWSGTVERVPGTPPLPAAALVAMRHREVEIHHADLGIGYRAADWPGSFLDELLDQLAADHAGAGPFTLAPTDRSRTWHVGPGASGHPAAPVVTGSAAALAWWLLGRETAAEVTGSTGTLPAIGPWRKSPVKR